jgi:leader peptidase (prepilin peptidase)/N-methyltransferase
MVNVFYCIIACSIGWLAGNIINYLCDVLPVTRQLSPPICIACKKKVPLFIYLALLKCPVCNKKREIRAWVVQFLIIVISLWLLFSPDVRFGYWISILVFSYCMIIAVIDIEYRVVLFQTVIAGAILAIPLGFFAHGVIPTIIGSMVGFLTMYIIYLMGNYFSKILSKIRRHQGQIEGAVGFGDVYLCVVIGLVMGWPGVIAGIVLGIVVFAVVGTVYILLLLITKKYAFSTALPMAPFLMAGMLLLLYRPGI